MPGQSEAERTALTQQEAGIAISKTVRKSRSREVSMEFKKVFISELKPAKYNPRKDLQPNDLEYHQIKRSIEEFGYVDPVIINSDNTVIGGHQRLKVLKELGHAQIDVVEIDIPKNKEKALNVALNKISGEWDMDRLTVLLDELKTEGLLEITGFDEKEFAALKADLEKVDEPKEVPLKSAFEVIIECPNESEQEKTYNELVEAGYKCRVLTL
jgi:ParB-like chromosome segregation protein Spo0J